MSVRPVSIRRVDPAAQLFGVESLAIALVMGLPALFTLSARGAALALLVFVAALAIYGAVARREILVADPIVVLGLGYVLAASVPFLASDLYFDDSWTLLSGELMHTATLWTYRGFVSMTIAYLAVAFLISRSGVRMLPPEPTDVSGRFLTLVGFIGLGGALTRLVMFGGPTEVFREVAVQASSMQQIADTLNLLGFAYVFLYRLISSQGIAQPIHRYLLWANVAIQLLFIIGAGSKALIIFMLVMLLLPTGREQPARNKGVIWKQIAIVAASVVAVYFTFQLITAYREIMRDSVMLTNATGFDRIALQMEAFGAAFQAALGLTPAARADVQTGNILDRFAYVSSFARVLLHTQGQSPYEYAFESFLLPLYAFLPRDLVAKPFFFGSNELASLEGWTAGGISVSLPGSLYWAWGYVGIVVGMAAIGAAVAWIVSRANASEGANTRFNLLKALMMLILLDVGNAFQPLIINLIRYAALVWLLDWIVRRSLTDGGPRGHGRRRRG